MIHGRFMLQVKGVFPDHENDLIEECTGATEPFQSFRPRSTKA